MIVIKKYSRLEEGPPKLLKTFSIKELAESVGKEIKIYESRLPKRKNKTYKKLQSKMMLLQAYKHNLEQSKTIEELSYAMSTSVRGRYRIEDPNGNVLKIVYENDGTIFWDFEDTSEGFPDEDINKKISPEQSAWERLKARLDDMGDNESFE